MKMKTKKAISTLLGFIMLFTLAFNNVVAFASDTTNSTAQTPADTPTIWIVGDSTVSSFTDNYFYPRYGWGTQIANYLDGSFNIKNLALSGRSSKSYTADPEYQTLLSGMKSGDYLLIGFGHNDEKPELERYTNPNGTYQDPGSFANSLYENYIKPAQAAGTKVILSTPIVRRTESGVWSNSNLHITDTVGEFPGGDYPQAIRDLGKTLNIPVVDMTNLTKTLYDQLGPSETLYLHAWTSSNPASVDNTHTNIWGGKYNAYLQTKAIKDLGISGLSEHVINAEAPTKADTLVSNPNYQETSYAGELPQSTLWADDGIWKGTVFGDIGGDPSTTNQTLETDSNGNMHIAVANNKGKISGTTDGIAMYYYKVPAKSTFTLTAKAKINHFDPNDQVSFGLMARDEMYIDKNLKSTLGDYVAAAPLKLSKAATGGFWNSFARKSGVLTQGGTAANPISAGDTVNLSITSNADGYATKFGNEQTITGGFDFKLTSVDPDYDYVGMFVSRNADITFSDIKLVVDGVEVTSANPTTPDPTTPDPTTPDPTTPVPTAPVPTTAPITSIEPLNLTTTAGAAPVMPTLVMAGYGDQSTLALDVNWESVDPSQYASPGSYTVKGKVEGTDIPAVANITVKPASDTAGGQDVQSYLKNLPFQAPNVTVTQFPDRDFNIKDYGAVGDGVTKNTDAFAKAIAACSQAGGGRVDVPEGVWVTGPIQLQSNVNLHLEKGAEILFSSDYNDYLSGSTYQYLLSSNGANNIAITGDGVINGQGQYWRPVKSSKMTKEQWNNLLASGGVVAPDGQWYPSQTMVGAKRPYMIDLRHSNNVLIDGPKLENSPMFTLSIHNDQNVVIRNTTINEPWWAQNGDGMDITSTQNIVIYHNTVNAGDDGICMKSSGTPSDTNATENVVVSDNIVFHAHGGFVVGSNTGGGIKNIMVRNNQFIDTDAGIKLKTYVGNGGPIENIYIDNINMQNIDTDAIHFDTYYNGDNAASQNAQPGDANAPEYKNIHLSNITVDGADQAVYIDALPHVPLHDVDFNNVTIHANKGFTSINADDVKLINVNITPSSGPVYTLMNSTNFLFDHVLCPVGADPFLHLEGNSSAISLKDTDTTPAKTAFVLDQGIAQDAIKIWDDVPPVTSAQISPSSPDGQNNWYVHPVTVTLSATDDRSGVDSTVYSINGGAWQTYNGPVTINNDGSYTIAYYSTDKNGNAEEAKNLSFQIDQTAPAISYSGNAGIYTIDQNVNISCNAGDSLSGVANSTCADISGPAYSFKLGTNAYSAQATDLAGNSGKGTTEFTVEVTYDSLINLTKTFVTDSGVANSLTAKLDAAIQSERRGNTNAMDNQLDAYVNEISAQSGKALTNEQADLLSQFAKELK